MPKRFLSGLVGIPLLVGVVFLPAYAYVPRGLPFMVVVLLLAILAMHEYCNGVRRLGVNPLEWLAYGAAMLFIVTAFLNGPEGHNLNLQPALSLLVIIGLVAELPRKPRAPVKNLGATALGVVYIGWLFSFLVLLRLVPGTVQINGLILDKGSCLAIYGVMLAWACDIGAFFVGQTFGRHKLAPLLSPGKTIEGAVAGTLSSMLISIPMGHALGFSVVNSIVLGFAISIVSQVGDLCKSSIKREIGIKDFGALVPGHGGILDRFDGLLFVSPALFYYYTWFIK